MPSAGGVQVMVTGLPATRYSAPLGWVTRGRMARMVSEPVNQVVSRTSPVMSTTTASPSGQSAWKAARSNLTASSRMPSPFVSG